MTTQIAVRLPDELIRRIDDSLAGNHESRSSLIRRAVELYVAWLANEQDAAVYRRVPLSDAELALTDDPASWADAPSW